MFYKYPSIDNLKSVKCDIEKLVGVGVMPTINLKGTVKIHGTNAGVTLERDGAMHVQSRNRVLSIQSDNAGFCVFCEPNEYFPSIANTLFNQYSHFNYITIYGEWCGGNIQAGVGISGMEKVFVIFSVAGREEEDEPPTYIPVEDAGFSHENNIYNISEFKTYSYCLDLACQNSIDDLHDITLAVEENCPVAAILNPKSTNTVGEGVVWTGEWNGHFIRFKDKGVRHRRGGSAKPRKVNVGGGYTHEQVAAAQKFCEQVVTEDRLLQGIEYMNEMQLDITPQNTGQYLKWVCNDIIKESVVELAELSKADLTWKQLSKQITRDVRDFYMNYKGI